ncbi:MAG: molybdopterin-binding protein [Chloroflexota bacterium]
MCDTVQDEGLHDSHCVKIPVSDAVGMVLGHDITEIRKDEFKGRAFRKGHIVKEEDICHFRRLGKEHLFVLRIGDDEMHEDDAAEELARALAGDGVAPQGEPREGKINLVASRDGLFKVQREMLTQFNMFGDVMCATLHDNTVVRRGQVVGGTRAIPLVVKRKVVAEALALCAEGGKVLRVLEMRRPRAGVVITGNEVYYGTIKDAFSPVIECKIRETGGEVIGTYYAPDDERMISERLGELLDAGADLVIMTGGMSVDPDDVTRFAIRRLGASDITYGSAVLPGAMFLVAYAGTVPIIGVPACGMYHKTTVLDLVLPRVLAGERLGRSELAKLGHGGLCLGCPECRFPLCPFGKG